MYKNSAVLVKADVETLVITEINGAKAAPRTVYENVQFECRISVAVCCWLFSKQLANVRLCKCLYVFNITVPDIGFMDFCKHLQ